MLSVERDYSKDVSKSCLREAYGISYMFPDVMSFSHPTASSVRRPAAFAASVSSPRILLPLLHLSL